MLSEWSLGNSGAGGPVSQRAGALHETLFPHRPVRRRALVVVKTEGGGDDGVAPKFRGLRAHEDFGASLCPNHPHTLYLTL
jgi:hypothetical protein